MITEKQYKETLDEIERLEKIIDDYHEQKANEFIKRHEDFLKGKSFYKDDELRFSKTTLCPCGFGLAYPKGCGGNHYWDCAGVLKGTADKGVEHCGELPFVFYDIKSEDEERTTRGIFRPKT